MSCTRCSDVEDVIQIPFSEGDELLRLGDTLPDRPWIQLDNMVAVRECLVADLSTDRLKQIYKILFLASSPRNISPLHHQAVKGRQVIVTERSDLHLLWHYERIFIKPIPAYLLSHEFWTTHLQQQAKKQDDAGNHDSAVELEALGFLRTYAQLIVHKYDFRLSQDLGLVPGDIHWDAWCRFIHRFAPLRDRDVAPRYHYGEIRLTRINLLSLVTSGTSYFSMRHYDSSLFAYLCAPYLFVFGAVTVLLTALQTALEVHPKEVYSELTANFVRFALGLTLASLGLIPLIFISFKLNALYRYLHHYRALDL